MISKLFLLQAISALHVGTGQGIGAIDQPIARTRATNLPFVPGTALKGVLRDALPLPEESLRSTLFGPPSNSNNLHAGALLVGDAHLLLLPVRSFHKVVVFASCPFVLQRYQRDAAQTDAPREVPMPKGECVLTASDEVRSADKGLLCLEDLDIEADQSAAALVWAEHLAGRLYPDDPAWRAEFVSRFVVLSDTTFSFLADTATEVRARVRIDDSTGTVADGALWYEESLPAESVLWGVAAVARARDRSGLDARTLADLLPTAPFDTQIGGKHTVGRGITRVVFGA